MDNISVSSSSTTSKYPEYSKKVQMVMTSSDNPMINFEKPVVPPASTSSMKQRGLCSQVAYLTSSVPQEKPSPVKTSKQCKTYSSINSLPGAFMVASQTEEVSKKQGILHKNRTTFDLPDEPPKRAKNYNSSKLDHKVDILQNVIYEDEPVGKKSIYATSNKLSHKFDIFGNETEVEPQGKNAKSWKSDKLEHHYDIFKQFDPVNS
ncbi:hypothetical protein SteCoe_22176 [Stentor coeruleus]|uniref:Uncharacterized protein n=1 Tax=Stentor coeruleus TaxID=5963 RepID=A0A1R2BMQ7_9CILI|nr:hypothetical protein SteCoe_22176 [Stentor coeruleus]